MSVPGARPAFISLVKGELTFIQHVPQVRQFADLCSGESLLSPTTVPISRCSSRWIGQ
jgi:hypothetical protein